MERPLKERLVGAAVLVLVVVLVLPELLSGRREVVTLQPTHDDGGVPLRAHEFVLGDAPTAEEQAVEADTLQQPEPLPGATSDPVAEALPEDLPAAEAPPAEAPPLAPSLAPSLAVAPQPAASARSPVVSPAATAPAAAPPVKPLPATPKAADPPPAARPAPAPAVVPPKRQPAAPAEARAPQHLGAWVVQIGSFGTAQKAEQLVKELRGQGFRAFTLPYTANGRTLHRVRVGPEQNRKVADDIARRLGDLGYNPQVAPQE